MDYNYNGMNPNRMNLDGMSPNRMNFDGMNPNRMNLDGMNPNRMNLDGMNPNRMNFDGMSPNGMNQDGMNFDRMNPYRRNSFGAVTGTIVDMVPTRMGNRRANGCMIFTTIEDMDGNTVNFLVTPSTFVVDWETLSVGMQCTFWYRTDAPVPLIYPPQYTAVVAAQEKNGRMIDVGYYNTSMVNEGQTLQLNIDGSVDIRTTNNQYFQGSPANHNLVVVYDTSTRSIPAQTTPNMVVVLCEGFD